MHNRLSWKNDGTPFYRVLDRNLRKAIRVSDNVLEVGRLESGYAQPEWQAFDLNDFLRRTFEQVMPYTVNESVDFFYQNTLSNPQIVVSDMEYMERILLNLVSNAKGAADDAADAERSMSRLR